MLLEKKVSLVLRALVAPQVEVDSMVEVVHLASKEALDEMVYLELQEPQVKMAALDRLAYLDSPDVLEPQVLRAVLVPLDLLD